MSNSSVDLKYGLFVGVLLCAPILLFMLTESLFNSSNKVYLNIALIIIYVPFWVVSFYIHEYYTEVKLRRQQIADLFKEAFLLNEKNVNNKFIELIDQLISNDPRLFMDIPRNYSSSVLIELINSNPLVFDPKRNSDVNNLRNKIDPIIINELHKLSLNNKYTLKDIFKNNPLFVNLFEKRNGAFVQGMKNFIEKV